MAVVIAPDGSVMVRKSDSGAVAEADEIGRRVGAALLAEGAREILEGKISLARDVLISNSGIKRTKCSRCDTSKR